MKFYVTYERNGIPQMMIVDASSVEKAEHYFRHKKPDANVYGLEEVTFEDKKKGIPILTAK